MNSIPCVQCVHYDQQYKYHGGKKKPVAYGWCKRKSEYPAQEWDGAVFDVDVKRVAASAHVSKPVIVFGNEVQTACLDVMQKP